MRIHAWVNKKGGGRGERGIWQAPPPLHTHNVISPPHQRDENDGEIKGSISLCTLRYPKKQRPQPKFQSKYRSLFLLEKEKKISNGSSKTVLIVFLVWVAPPPLCT